MPRVAIDPLEHSRSAGISMPGRLLRAARKVASKKNKSLSLMVKEDLMRRPDVRKMLKAIEDEDRKKTLNGKR